MSNTWRYIKGSEADFQGAPDWAMVAVRFGDDEKLDFAESYDEGSRIWYADKGFETKIFDLDYWTLIAQRERVSAPQWRYIKGSESDFIGAPDWATVKGSVVKLKETLIAWEGDGVYQYINSRYHTEKINGKFVDWNWENKPEIIAQRERVPAPQWRYIKGSEEDFKGAPDWADRIIKIDDLPRRYADKHNYENEDGTFRYIMSNGWTLIAQRERVPALCKAAVATLERKGYTWCGGEEWKPPLGKPPAYITDDTVNHPSHYTQGGIECIDAIQAATVGKTGIEAACVANIIKYLWRYELKNGVQDIEKAQWYLNKLLEVKR